LKRKKKKRNSWLCSISLLELLIFFKKNFGLQFEWCNWVVFSKFSKFVENLSWIGYQRLCLNTKQSREVKFKVVWSSLRTIKSSIRFTSNTKHGFLGCDNHVEICPKHHPITIHSRHCLQLFFGCSKLIRPPSLWNIYTSSTHPNNHIHIYFLHFETYITLAMLPFFTFCCVFT